MKGHRKVFSGIRLILLAAAILAVCIFLPQPAVLPEAALTPASPALLKVDFLNVGQADCILIRTPGGKTLLIDAGNNNDYSFIRSYLLENEIAHLDVVIGTHPHEDHIGGLDRVINDFSVGSVYLPKVTTNTKTFRDLLLAIKDKGLSITTPRPGLEINLDPAVDIRILAPAEHTYNDLNDYSIVMKISYGCTAFLFTGDAEAVSELEMVHSGQDLKADVLKVAHHGSESSSTEAFLAEVAPQYAVISVGRDNNYGHPAPQIIDRLSARGVKILRTDEAGTICFISDGRLISVILHHSVE